MRDLILNEIRRLAAEQGGRPPGRRAFEKATGIPEAKWHGVFWPRWGDAVVEAGLLPNEKKVKLDSAEVAADVATFVLEIGRLPTRAEMRVRRKADAAFPSHGVLDNHFPTQAELFAALRAHGETAGLSDLLQLLPEPSETIEPTKAAQTGEGWVYLLKSGDHYKIGRSDNLERRLKEVRVALPEAVALVHSIRTDDPSGIEGYWHRRFAEKRANGEWFKLTAADVRAFSRRTFQ